MTRDMKIRLNSIDSGSMDNLRGSRNAERMENWLNYVREIDCHNEIVGYLLDFGGFFES